MSNKNYWKEVEELAEDLLCTEEDLTEAEVPQEDIDEELEEYIRTILDGSDWLLDDESCLQVLSYTKNREAYQDAFEDIDHLSPYKFLAKEALKSDILDSFKSLKNG